MSTIVICILVYIVGFFISLAVLHKWAHVLECDHYDPPHEGWYDDWDSNAQAYVGFSFAWPIFYTIHGLRWVWLTLVAYSDWLGEQEKKKDDSI